MDAADKSIQAVPPAQDPWYDNGTSRMVAENSRVGFPPPPRHHYLSRLFADAETLQVAPYARLPSSGTSILDLGAHEAVAVGGKAEKSALAFGQVAPSTLQPRCPDPPHTNHVVPDPPYTTLHHPFRHNPTPTPLWGCPWH